MGPKGSDVLVPDRDNGAPLRGIHSCFGNRDAQSTALEQGFDVKNLYVGRDSEAALDL